MLGIMVVLHIMMLKILDICLMKMNMKILKILDICLMNMKAKHTKKLHLNQ